MRFRYADGGCGLSTATRSGRARKPCSIRPNVPGKAPPPCANAIRRRGRRSRKPPKMREQMASETSAGMPTSQGSQYFRILASPIMSQGWTKIAAPSSAARANTGKRAASDRFQSFAWEPICTPARPSWTQRSSSRTARSGDCSGSVPSPTKRRGCSRQSAARWSLSTRARSSPRFGWSWYPNRTGTVDSTCTPTPVSSHSRSRCAGSQQLLSTSRNTVPSSRSIRARHSPVRSSRMGLQRGSSGGSTCVCTSRLRMLAAALAAGRVRRVAPVVLEHRRELLDDVGEMERFPIQLAAAAVADPEEGVLLPRQPAPLDHQPHRVGRALRGVGRVGRKQEDLSFPDGNVHALSGLQRAQHDVAFHLVEELLALVEVVVGARVRSAHHRDHEVAVSFPDLRVSHRRLEQVAVLVDPLAEVERLHGDRTSAMHFSSMAMGVGSAVTSTVVRQGRAPAKYSAYSRLKVAKSRPMSVRKTVMSTRSSQRAPASSRTQRTLSNTARHCTAMS